MSTAVKIYNTKCLQPKTHNYISNARTRKLKSETKYISLNIPSWRYMKSKANEIRHKIRRYLSKAEDPELQFRSLRTIIPACPELGCFITLVIILGLGSFAEGRLLGIIGLGSLPWYLSLEGVRLVIFF